MCRCRYPADLYWLKQEPRQILVRCVIFLRIVFAGSRLITGDPACKEALLTAKQPVRSSQMFAQRFAKSRLGLKHKVAGIGLFEGKEQGYHNFIHGTSHTSWLWSLLLLFYTAKCVFKSSLKCFVFSTTTFLSCPLPFLVRETNLKFKMGLRVTDERLQEERQLAAFDGECCALVRIHFHLWPKTWMKSNCCSTSSLVRGLN